MNTFSRVAILIVGMTGFAAAQPKTEPKPADPKMMPKTDAKPADAKAGGMEMKPPAELAEMAKAMTGTWRCKGQGMDMRTNKMTDMNATMRIKLEHGGWWVHQAFESRMGKEPFTFDSFITVDPASKKLKRVMVEAGGGWSTGEAAMVKDKTDWDMTAHSAMGEVMFRDHEDMTDPKVGAKMWGEFSPDKGKTWTKVYETTCKK